MPMARNAEGRINLPDDAELHRGDASIGELPFVYIPPPAAVGGRDGAAAAVSSCRNFGLRDRRVGPGKRAVANQGGQLECSRN